jgi:hypothetical protein
MILEIDKIRAKQDNINFIIKINKMWVFSKIYSRCILHHKDCKRLQNAIATFHQVAMHSSYLSLPWLLDKPREGALKRDENEDWLKVGYKSGCWIDCQIMGDQYPLRYRSEAPHG